MDALDCASALPLLLEGAERLGLSISLDRQELFSRYCSMLQETNRHYNLTSVRSAEGIMSTLFLDSLAVTLALPAWAKDGTLVKVVDVGSGAGLPGLPLKIVFPHWRLTLVESIGKKARFLSSLTKSLGLDLVEVATVRAEELAAQPARREAADVCLARAVASLPSLIEYCAPFVRHGGLLLFPKSGDVASEVARADEAATTLACALDSITQVPEDLGLGTGRVIVAYRRTGHIPTGYPRRTGLARSRPIGS